MKKKILYIYELEYSEYAENEVIQIEYDIDLVKSCEATIEVRSILVVKD